MGLRDRLSSLDKRDTVNAAGTSQISTESGGIRSRLNAARKEKETETNYKPDISRFVSGYAGLIKQFNDGLNSTEKYASRNTNDESSSISGKILSANLNMQESTVNDMLNDLAKNRENYAKAIGTDRITEIENNLRQIGEFTKSERDISAESNDKVKRSVQGFNSIQGPYKSNADYENALKHFTENADKNNEIIQDANAARTSGPLLDAEGQKLISETQQLHPFGTLPLKPETIADYDIYPHYGNSDGIETPLDRINATDGRILPGTMDDEDRINYMAGESNFADYEALKPFDNAYRMFAERGAPEDEQDRLIITRGIGDIMSQLEELYDDENSPTSEMAHEYMDMFDKLFVKYSDSNYVLDQLITGMKTAVGGYAGLGYGIQNALMGGKLANDQIALERYFFGDPEPSGPESDASLDAPPPKAEPHTDEYNILINSAFTPEEVKKKILEETNVLGKSFDDYIKLRKMQEKQKARYGDDENKFEYVSKPAKVVGKIANQVGQQLPSWAIGGAYGAAFSGASEAASLTEHIVNAFKGGGIKEIGTGLITAAKGNMTTNLMGLSAAGNRLTENLSKYGSTPEAYAEAAINGFFESFTEGLFGYSDAAGLGKVLSTTGASKIENVLKTLTNYLINSGEEGLEEVVNVPLQGLAEKALINNDKPWVGDGGVFDAREMISNGVDGALMGAVLGSVGVIAGSISNIGNAKQIRTAAEALNQVNEQLPDEYKLKEINTSRATVEDVERFSAELLKAQQQIVADDYLDNIDALIESGMESPAGTDSRIIAEKLQEKINSGVKITSEDALELAEANYRQVNFENSSDEQNGMDALYAAYSDNPTDENSQALTSAIEEAGDLGEALLDTSRTRYETGEIITEPTDLSGIDKAKTPVPGALSIMPSDIQHVVVNGNEVKYVTKAGDVVSAKEVDLGSSDNVLFGEYTKGMSSEDANEMISAYRDYGGDIDPRVFGSEWRHIRNVGRTGALKTHAAYSDFDASFGEELKAIAYNQGLQERAREAAKIKQKNNVEDKARQIVEKRKKASKTGGKGVVNDSALKRSGASNRAQNAAMKYSRALARFGYNVTFFNDSVIIDGKKHKANGAYDAETNTIYLRCDTRFKGTDIRGVLGQTLSHEIVHSIQAWNKEGYDELCDYIRQTLPDDIERLIRDKMEGLHLDYSEAFDEVIADGCEMMLKDSETVAKMARENYGLFTKVKQAIDDFIKRLTHVQKELYIDSEGRDSGEIHEAAKALRAALSDFKEMQAIFDKAFEGTLKNMSEGFGIESENNSISEDTTTHEDKSEERKAEKGKSNTPSKTEKANKNKTKADEKLEDFGEKIGGAKKDIWKDRGLVSSDLDDMNSVEGVKYVKKDNVWKKPDYTQMMKDGVSKEAAWFQKRVRDALPAKPVYSVTDNTEELKKERQAEYVQFVRDVQEVLENVRTEEDAQAAFDKVLVDKGYVEKPEGSYRYQIIKCYDLISSKLFGAIQLSKTYSGKSEWQLLSKAADSKQFGIAAEDKVPAGYTINMYDGTGFSRDGSWKAGTYYITHGRGRIQTIVQTNFETRESALSWLREKIKPKKGKTRYVPAQLEAVHRDGDNVRSDGNIKGEQYMDTFGFRGGEFGNWMNAEDRRVSMNYGYDALHDLAVALDIEDEDISFAGKLAIAFGARGNPGAAAHYEPGAKVINLTKMNGAGSLAHEWGHGLDDFIGTHTGQPELATNGNLSKMESLKAVVDVMKKKKASAEYVAEEREKSQNRALDSASNTIDYYFGTMTDEQRAKLEKLKEKAYEAAKNDDDKAMADAITEISQFRKAEKNHIIPAEDRNNILYRLWGIRSYSKKSDSEVLVDTDFYEGSKKFDKAHSKQDKGYWSSDCEMLARAFACYVEDKLKEKGVRSDYLCGHADVYTELEYDKNTGDRIGEYRAYPVGEERKAINKAFDALVSDLKVKGILNERTVDDNYSKIRYSEEEDEFTSGKRELVWSEDAWSDKTQRDRLIDDLEAVAQNQTDRLFISRLREEAINANTYESELSTIQREIQEIKFTSGSDRTRLPELEKKRSALEAAIINSDRKLYGYRNGQVYKRLAERSTRAIINNQKSIVSKRSEESYRNELYGKIIKKIDAIMTLSESTTKGKHMPSSMKHTVNLLREGMFHAPAYMKMAAQTQRNIDETEMELKGAKANAAAAQNDIEIRGSNEIALAKLKKYNDYISRLEYRLASLRKKVKDYERKSLEAAKNATDIVNQFSAMNDEIFDENVNSKVAELIKMLNGRLLFTLTIEEMETFNDTMTMMNKAISNAKKAFISGRGIAEMAYDVALEIKRNDRAYTKAELVAKKMKDFLKYGMMKPWELFESSSSPTLIELYRNLQKGEGDYGRLIKKYSAAYRDLAESHEIKQAELQKKITTESLSDGRELELTVGEVMSLYALYKRKQGAGHLISDMFGQGFLLKGDIIKEKVSTGKPNAYEYKYRTDSKPVKITDNDIKGIIKKLSNEQKAFVDSVQKYMSTELADDGNRVSMLMYDVRIFNEKFYFPIKIAHGYNVKNVTEKKANDANPKIKNKGFTKELIDDATAPILIESFDQAWAGHANEMATYAALALPLDDMDRVIHYIEKESLPENQNKGRTALSIPLVLGQTVVNEAKDFINDVNGGIRSEDSIFSSKLISLNKAAKVMANIRVAIQQPAAIIRACALIDPKYLLGFSTKGMSDTAKMKLYDEMIKYTSTAVIKELGGVDIDTSQSVKDTLTDLGFANNSAKNKYSEVKDKLGILAEYGDRVAWLNLWNACKREALAEGYTGQGLLKRAGERFDEITNKTQVYDSVFSRSKWMRKKSAMSKMVTSFMAEPITCANMLMDALRLAQNGQKKKAMRYTASVIASIIVTNLLSSLCDAGRDDDDDETFLEKYLSSLAANITNDMIPLNYIPGARDILSILQGYDIERMDVALISDIIDSVKSCANRVKNGKDATDELIKLGSKVGDIAGIPLTNIRREILSILNIKDIAMRGDKTTETGLQIAMREWENGIPLYSWFAGGITDSDKLYYATINGDGEYFERISGSISKELADKGKTDDEISKNIEAKIKKGLAENDIRVAAAAEARINGDTEEYINMVHKISSDGFAEAIVEKAILSVQNSLNGDEGVDSVIDGMLYTSGDICLSAEKGDTAPLEEYYQIKLDYYKDKKNEGDKNVKNPSAKALASVKSMLSSEYRKAYAQAYEDKNESECDRIRDLLCELTVSGRRIFKNSDITGWKDYDANNK